MSNLDGGGPGISASRFGDGNVKLTLVGNGADQPHPAQFPACRTFHCPAYQTCIDMYNTPNDNWATHVRNQPPYLFPILHNFADMRITVLSRTPLDRLHRPLRTTRPFLRPARLAQRIGHQNLA